MTSLVDRLKSMKSLKSLKTLHVAQVPMSLGSVVLLAQISPVATAACSYLWLTQQLVFFQVEVESDVTETPSDPSVKEAEAHLPEVSPSSSYEVSCCAILRS